MNPHAIRVLAEHGIEWNGHQPKGTDTLDRSGWDIVITVCDRAKESCPIFPGQPVVAHWGMPDPAECEGSDERKLEAFRETLRVLDRRLDQLLALTMESPEGPGFARRVSAIGEER